MSRGKRGRVICEPGTTSTESRSVLYRAHCCSVSSRGRVPQPLTLSVTHFPFIICPLCIRASTFRIAHARYRSKRISFAKPSFLRFSTRNETPRRVLITRRPVRSTMQPFSEFPSVLYAFPPSRREEGRKIARSRWSWTGGNRWNRSEKRRKKLTGRTISVVGRVTLIGVSQGKGLPRY